MPRTLLLNKTHEYISFISDEKALRHVFNNKVDILETWDIEYKSGNQSVLLPAVLRMKYKVKTRPRHIKCSRYNILKRDHFTCQYCGIPRGNGVQITIDHVIPQCRGGRLTWENCVAACKICNGIKGKETLESSGLRLRREPRAATVSVLDDYDLITERHPLWGFYLGL